MNQTKEPNTFVDVLKVFGIIAALILLAVGTYVWYVTKPTLSNDEMKKLVEEQLTPIFQKKVTVTDVKSRLTANGEYYTVQLKIEGRNETFTLDEHTGSFYSLDGYSIMYDIWNKQYQEEIQRLFEEKGFQMRNSVTASTFPPKDMGIDIKTFPTLQELRVKYGEKFDSSNLQVFLKTPYPKDEEGKKKENEKVFSVVKELEKRKIRTYSLSIDYLGEKGSYIIDAKNGIGYQYGKQIPIEIPEDLENFRFPKN